MAVSVQQIKQEIADRCNTISGLRCNAFLPASPQPPAMGVALARASYNVTEDGDWMPVFTVYLYVNPSDLNRAQQTLDQWLAPVGTASVVRALQDVEVTPDIIQSLRVIGVPGPYAIIGDQSTAQTLVAMLDVEIYPVL